MTEQQNTEGESKEVTYKGKVERVFYSSPDFTAGVVAEPGKKGVSFAGPMAANVGDHVVLHGEWVEHEKFGLQIKVKWFEVDLDLDDRGLAGLLANHPDFKGIGPAKARKIAEAFGQSFERTLVDEPSKIASVAGISLDAVDRLRTKWMETRELNASMTWLAGFGLTHHQTKTLIDRFGNGVAAVLKKDPYVIIQKVRGFGFKRADDIARKIGIPLDHPARLGGSVMYVLAERKERGGDCFVEREELLASAQRVLAGGGTISYESIDRAIDDLVEREVLVTTKFENADGDTMQGVGTREMFEMERWLYDFFVDVAQRKNSCVEELDLKDGDPDHELKGRQEDALRIARERACLLMTGGAGSGKTFTIAAIIRMYSEAGLEVAVAAPTGKAARRIEEVSGHEAKTIHRLLAYKGTGFEHGPKNPISADVLVVDEVSMLDVWLAWSLFRAVDLSKTAIVLVGDPNQLPPVGPGNVLRDLLKRKFVPTVELDQIHRQAGVLRENCIAILKSTIAPTVEPVPDPKVEGRLIHPWNVGRNAMFKEPKRVRKYLLDLYEKTLLDKLGFDLVDDVQLLTPKHEGPLGTAELNVMLQRLVQRKLWSVDVPPPAPGRRPKLYLRDRVIQTRNDYELEVMNGSVGTVCAVDDNGVVSVDFDGEEVAYSKETMRDLELAYALTIHKSQGSEFPCVILVVHKDHAFMHHRNLFYTGVTRARRTVVVVGDPEGMDRCAKRGEIDRRRTFLSVM